MINKYIINLISRHLKISFCELRSKIKKLVHKLEMSFQKRLNQNNKIVEQVKLMFNKKYSFRD